MSRRGRSRRFGGGVASPPPFPEAGLLYRWAPRLAATSASMGPVWAYAAPGGATPPTCTVSGVTSGPTVPIAVRIIGAGARGVATYQWSTDNGATWSATATTSASEVLGSSGITFAFGAGTYDEQNLYISWPQIATLADQSGNAEDASQATAARQFEYRPRRAKGRAAMRAERTITGGVGAAQVMTVPSLSGTAAPCSLWVYGKALATNTYSFAFDMGSGGAISHMLSGSAAANQSNWGPYMGGLNATSGYGNFKRNRSMLTLVDGSGFRTVSDGTVSSHTAAAAGGYGGATPVIGAETSAYPPSFGGAQELVEIAGWDHELTTDELAALAAYEAYYYGCDYIAYDGNSYSAAVWPGAGWLPGETIPDIMASQLSKVVDVESDAGGGKDITGILGCADPINVARMATRIKAGTRKNIYVLFENHNELYKLYLADPPTCAATAYANLLAHLTVIKAQGWDEVVLVSALPTSLYAYSYVSAYNALIVAEASPPWDVLVDMSADMTMGQDGDNLNTTYYMGDSVHPNETGCRYLAAKIAAAVEPLLS